MKQDRGRALRGTFLVAAAASFAFAGSASAQIGVGETPGAALRRQIAELAANPNSVSELVETGRAALTVGDGEGALGFFTRAAQLAPRDARVKAGLAAANARTGRPETALMLFAEAQALGAAAGEIAGERGLAYDLLGQTARAQQDYLVSLRHREDVEVRRRLALSLAISGQREAALRLIESQVRLGDRAAARTRVMVLALTGDANGATAAARASLPPGAAQSLSPFLARLASMTPGQMAAAANLGRVSGTGGLRATGTARAPADPAALAFAGGGAPPASLAGRLPVAPASSDGVRRRQGVVNSATRSAARQPATTSDRVLASSSTPVTPPRQAGEPRGTWAGVTSSAAARPVVTATLGEAFLQPHPHQPLRFAANVAAPGATSAPLTGTGGPGLPAGTAPAPTATPAPSSPNAAAAVANFTLPAQGSASSAGLTDNAAANLAVWTSGAPTSSPASAELQPSTPAAQATAAAAAEPPAVAVPSTAGEPRAVELASVQSGTAAPVSNPAVSAASASTGFADVVALVSELETETKVVAEEKPAASTAKPDSAGGATTRSRTAARPAAPTDRKAASTRAVKAEERKATSMRAAAAEGGKNGTARPAPKSGAKAASTRTAAPAHPSRIWVQLAVSPNRSAFTFDMNRLRKSAPELLKDRAPHVAPIGSNHRLLVGPFTTEAAARSFVNDLKKKDISSISWTSPAGTEVERLPTRR